MVSSCRGLIKLGVVTCVFSVVLIVNRSTVLLSSIVEVAANDKVSGLEHSQGSNKEYEIPSVKNIQWDDSLSYRLRKLKWMNSVGLGNRTGNGGIPGNPGVEDDDSVECGDVHKMVAAQRCDFVTGTDDCQIDEGFLDYTKFVFCDFKPELLPLGVTLLVIWWFFLFVALAVTADDFFCPSLAVISDTMRLSQNIAGVTFLAFGNGAPDIFSAIAAIGNAKNGDAGLAIGALFGAGVFVTTVVAGTIAIIHPFDAMQRPFLRDIIFFIAATFWTFWIMWKKEITKFEAIGFILMYVVYVVVVVVGRYVYTQTRNRLVDDTDPRPETPSIQDILDGDGDLIVQKGVDHADGERQHLIRNGGDNVSYTSIEDTDNPQSPILEFFNKICPIDRENWSGMSLFKKAYEIFKSPIMFLLLITVPIVNYEEREHSWNRHLFTLQCVTGPMFSVAATKVGFTMVNGNFPAWAITLILSIALAALVFFTSKNEEKPKYQAAFAYLGFVVAVVWIYSIANEIVNILQTFGIVLHISNAILGLTLLAWGNSIGDFIADTVMARQGYPRMGISACFGGPLFNLLLGIGIPFTIATIKDGTSYKLKITLEEVVLAAFLLISLISSLIIVPLSGFKMTRAWGIYLLVLYAVFLVVAIMTESGVIHANIPGLDKI